MERATEIEQRIVDLERELEEVEGTQTEIYTRIVGYYRSLKNWNKGKREEYDHRVTFKAEIAASSPSDRATRAPRSAAPVAQVFAEAALEAAAIPAPAQQHEVKQIGTIQSYQYYFRENCPNCPPVRTYVENLELNGQMVDVDTGEGMAQAVEHQILSTPTVILMNDKGDPIAQAGSVEQLRGILESAG